MKRKEPLKPIGEVCDELWDLMLDEIAAKYPQFAKCTRYGFRVTESPREQAVIRAALYARGCGKSAGWIADQLNQRGNRHRGKVWTARAVCRILKHFDDRKGDTEENPWIMSELFKKTEQRIS